MPIEKTSDVVDIDLSDRHHLQCCSCCKGSYIYHRQGTVAEYNPMPLTDSRFVSTNSASILIEAIARPGARCDIGRVDTSPDQRLEQCRAARDGQ
jgi:hypothetical protein